MLVINKTMAKCTAVNVTRLGKEDEAKLILKARFTTIAPSEAIRRVMGLDLVPDLWDTEDPEINPRYWSIEWIDLEGKFKSQSIDFADITFSASEISKIRFQPIPNALAIVEFTARVAFPSPDHVARLCDRLQEEFYLTVDAPPDMFEDGEGPSDGE